MFVNQPDDAQLVTLWHDPEGGTSIGTEILLALRPASRRVFPLLLPPVDGQIQLLGDALIDDFGQWKFLLSLREPRSCQRRCKNPHNAG